MASRLADVWPLTAAQEALFYHALLDADGPDVYLVQCRFAVDAPVDAAALRAAVDALLDRHPNLRVCFRHKGLERPVQAVPHRAAVPWTEVEAPGAAALADVLAADRARRFDLGRPPLLRCTLVRRGGAAELVLTLHHILMDGWSMGIVQRELAALYAGGAAGLPPAPPYREYLAWLRRQAAAAATDAYRAALDGVRGATLVAGDSVDRRANRRPMLPEAVDLELPEGLSGLVRQRAGQAGVTVNTVAQAAWGLVLARMTGRDDVVFGAVVSGRPPELAGAGSMVGLLVNTVPVRVALRAGEPVGRLLARIQQEQARLLPHHHVRIADLRRAVGEAADFDAVFAFENFPRADGAAAGPLRLVEVRDANHQPLTLLMAPGERLWLRLLYRPDCFARPGAELVARRLVRAFELLAGDPDAPADRLDVLPAAERRTVLEAFHGAPRPPLRRSIVEQFAAQVARNPAGVAVRAPAGTLSYAELDSRSHRLAGRLAGAGAVAILMDRSADLVVAQLAVLKAGGHYLPLDPDQPAARLDWLLRDAGARLVLTDRPDWTAPEGVRVLLVDDSPGPPPPGAAPHPDAAACLMYTSGSTGAPKGVVVTHHNIVELAADHRFANGAHARVLLHNPHTFDAVTYELWVPLLTGGTVVVAPPGRLEPYALRKVAAEGRVTAVCLTPELLRVVLDLAPDALAGLREVWPAGDVVTAELIRRTLAAAPDAVVVNGYGPTETTTFATCHATRDAGAGPVPIGRPFDNTGAYVLDGRLRPVPVGAVGELYLSGTGVSRGYLNQPARTAERFVANPYAPGERMYRTGDLVRWTAEGVLEFAGRADDQLKVRGFRVEPGEVETVLERCPGVRRAVVAAVPGPEGGKRLVAYLTAGPGTEFEQVRRYALQHLPGHLVPDGYVPIERVPLNAHGKVDRSALPRPAAPAAAGAAGAPLAASSPQEEALCRAFGTVLRLPAVAPGDNFFDLGGDSLLAMRLTAEIEAALGIRLPISAVFDAPTPATLVPRLAEGGMRDLGTAPLLTLRSRGAGTPLYCVHPAMGLGWSYGALLPHLAPGRPVYALQSPALGGDGPLPESVEEIAEDYVARVVAAWPDGPYALVGRSFGGTVAYEMAVRLRRAGRPVALLAVLDTVPAQSVGEPAEVEPDLVGQAALNILAKSVPGYAPPPGRLERAGVYAAVRAGGPLRGSADERLDRLAEVCERHIVIAQRYRPGPFDGTVTLFSATGQPGGRSSRAKVDGWLRTAAGVDLHEVAGGHSDVLRPGAVERIAAVVDAKLGGA